MNEHRFLGEPQRCWEVAGPHTWVPNFSGVIGHRRFSFTKHNDSSWLSYFICYFYIFLSFSIYFTSHPDLRINARRNFGESVVPCCPGPRLKRRERNIRHQVSQSWSMLGHGHWVRDTCRVLEPLRASSQRTGLILTCFCICSIPILAGNIL